jgi:hypothetical protein
MQPQLRRATRRRTESQTPKQFEVNPSKPNKQQNPNYIPQYMKTRNILLLAMGTALMAGLPSVAHAGNYQVYGSEWAVNNDYNASGQIGCSFGSGSSPSLTAWFNFSDSSKIWGYPACIRGYHYGQNPAGDTLFPFQVSSKSSIPCNFSYSAGASMKGDFAYDMFLRWDNSVTYPNATPQCEIMVWAGGGSYPLGNCTATYAVYTAGQWFDLWEGYNSGAGYYVYTFIPNGTAGAALPTSGSLNVDMKVFFNWLQSNRSGSGYYNDSMYLDVIEAGYEIVKGNSWIWIQGDFNATTGSSSSGISSGSTYKLIARHSGKAMDASGYGTSNGTQIQQWTYGSGANQKWTVTDTGSGYYKIIGVQSGKSLDIDYSSGGTANGTKVQLWDYWNGASQQYKFAATDSGYYRITPNCATGSCLDVSGVSTANGAKVQLWQWVSGNNQQWSLQSP